MEWTPYPDPQGHLYTSAYPIARRSPAEALIYFAFFSSEPAGADLSTIFSILAIISRTSFIL